MGTKSSIQLYLICTISLNFIYVFRWSDAIDTQSSATYLIEVCSNYFGCGSGNFYTGFKLCCVTCNCNKTCIDTHSCCAESEYASTITKPYRSDDVRLVCRKTVLIGQERSIYDHPEYEFIETCADTSDETTRLYCEEIALTNRSDVVADNTPVLDTIGGFSYRNIYCARCNEIDLASLEVWRPKLECKTNFDLRTESFSKVNGLEQLIEYNDCLVSFEPPLSYDVKQCYVDVISTCNVTGRWSTYNQNDVIQCQALDLIYVSIEDYMLKYRNIFCARCNGENVNTQSLRSCPTTSNRFTSALTTILGFTMDDLEPSSQSVMKHLSSDECPQLFKLDPFTGECRPLFCSLPFSIDAVTSECRLFHQFMDNGKFVHAYKLVFQQSTPIRDAQALAETIYTRIIGNDILFNCDISFYYQTEIAWNLYTNKTSLLDINVSSMYISVYSYVTGGNQK